MAFMAGKSTDGLRHTKHQTSGYPCDFASHLCFHTSVVSFRQLKSIIGSFDAPCAQIVSYPVHIKT